MTPITFSFDIDDTHQFNHDIQEFCHFFRKHCGDPKKFCSMEGTGRKQPPNSFFTFDFKRKGSVVHIMDNFTSQKQLPTCLEPKIYDPYFKGSNLWLLKPTGLNRGVGIEVFDSLEGLNKYLNEYLDAEVTANKKAKSDEEDDADNNCNKEEETRSPQTKKKGPPAANFKSRTFVVQKYIESPLLVYNRKFDIRLYALVTHDMKLYFFK